MVCKIKVETTQYTTSKSNKLDNTRNIGFTYTKKIWIPKDQIQIKVSKENITQYKDNIQDIE